MNPIFEIVIFTLNAIFIYFAADWIVRMIEVQRGEVFKQRQVVFFVVILALALITFRLLRVLLTSGV